MYRVEIYNQAEHRDAIEDFGLRFAEECGVCFEELSLRMPYILNNTLPGNFIYLVLFRESEIIGILLFSILPSFADIRELVATELHFYILEPYRKTKAWFKLYAFWLAICKHHGVKYMTMNKSESLSEKLLTKLGFDVEQRSFRKVVCDG